MEGVPTLAVPGEELLFFVGGLWRPRILISTGAIALLSADELHASIQHELVHVRRRDNLKKLLLQFCALPPLVSLDREWLKAAELAADDEAGTDDVTALSLASALVRMTRAASRAKAPELGMALFSQNASLDTRVQRLLAGRSSTRRSNRVLFWALLAAVGFVVGANFSSALAGAHQLTEFLMR